MRVFVTGATGFIGARIVADLIGAGHQVIGLTRSDAGARALESAGAEAYRGTLEDPGGLRPAAARADAVIHTAFDHDFSNFVANCDKDGRVIEALAAELQGSSRPLVITSGTGMGTAAPGQMATEDHFDPDHMNPRKASEIAGTAALQTGVNVCFVRLPQVHDPVKQGLITPLIDLARQKGVFAYVGDGANRYPAVHVTDAARLYRLAVEKQAPGARYHAVAEQGVAVRAIAETIARGMKIPAVSLPQEEAVAHFGWLGMFVGLDMPASSALTQERLGWHPSGPGLLEDLASMRYDG